MARENCPPLLWQTVDQTPRQRWSSWDGCSGHLRNFCGVMPKARHVGLIRVRYLNGKISYSAHRKLLHVVFYVP